MNKIIHTGFFYISIQAKQNRVDNFYDSCFLLVHISLKIADFAFSLSKLVLLITQMAELKKKSH